MKFKNIIIIITSAIVCWLLYSFYTISSFDMFEDNSSKKIIQYETDNQKYIASSHYFDTGAVGLGKTASFLTVEVKKNGVIYEILSSDYVHNIYWLSDDSLEVVLSKNIYIEMKDYKNDNVVVLPTIIE